MMLLGIIFLGREIELANARRDDLMINHVTLEVTWLLPASKTDPQVKGVRRTLGC